MLTISFVLSSLPLLAIAAPHDSHPQGIPITLSKRNKISIEDIVNPSLLNSIRSAVIS